MNMIQPLLDAVSPQAVQSIAGSLNETPEHTRQGIADALPMIMAGLIGKGSTPNGAAGVLSMIRERNVDFISADRFARGQDTYAPPNLFREGGSIAENLLGNQFNGAADAIATHAGVARNSALALLGLATPLVLSGIAKAAPRSGFTPETLIRFLQGQRTDLAAASPIKLPADLLGVRQAAPAAAPPARRNTLWPWAVGLAAALLLAILLGQWSGRRDVTVAAPAVNAAAPSLRIALPDGVTLDLPRGSIGERLANYLGNAQPTPQTFAFENMNFETGEVVLTPESTATLNAIAAILRAYPNAVIRLDGHTDATGDRAANVALSTERANSVMRALAARGVEATRMTAVGYGPDRPIASNDTEEGRAANRRLELTVIAK